jgi:hypothetical protein
MYMQNFAHKPFIFYITNYIDIKIDTTFFYTFPNFFSLCPVFSLWLEFSYKNNVTPQERQIYMPNVYSMDSLTQWTVASAFGKKSLNLKICV